MLQPTQAPLSPIFFEAFCPVLVRHVPGFNAYDFLTRVFGRDWPDLDSDARVERTARALEGFIPDNSDEAAAILRIVGIAMAAEDTENFTAIILNRYLEQHGQPESTWEPAASTFAGASQNIAAVEFIAC